MSHHVLSVCVFCLICATHSPCSSHATVEPNAPQHWREESSGALSRVKLKSEIKLPPKLDKNTQQTKETNGNGKYHINIHPDVHIVQKRDSIKTNNNISKNPAKNYSGKIFEKFGDGNTMSMEGFEKFIERLDLLQILSSKIDNMKANSKDVSDKVKVLDEESEVGCIDRIKLFSEFQNLNVSKTDTKINDTMLIEACPAILYTLMTGRCNEEPHVHAEEARFEESSSISVWLYSTIAVILTSACGVLALVIIPVMQKKIYKPLLQFLVALAVGTLAGDAFLHLLPHAMTKSHHSHDSNGHRMILELETTDSHDENMWKGLVAMSGVIFFFFMERLILLAGKWRKNHSKKTQKRDMTTPVKFLQNGFDDFENNPTQCMDRYNPYPFCYQDILNHQLHGCALESDRTASTELDDVDTPSDVSSKKSKSLTIERMGDNQDNMVKYMNENNISCTEVNRMLPEKPEKKDNITIILREHGSRHHGHSHSHGHVHAAPQNFSSVAWMVIMGDGLHNFTDGMAIGAAFSNSLAGGFSTAVAVFCHELPHELGDFAMLLKAGMTTRQALFYNLLSSVLSLLGNVLGIYVGNTEYASSWIFAAAAGMFIYIALVDMIPELSSTHEDESNLTQLSLHLGGLMAGFGIMTVIAVYEHDLKTIFKETV